ncbi:uncharacterized protein N7473_011853 [Penicillium subrubescens]|uniref:uncharacterized protein n=1 Tax=Penicillium subrubescens TaxID=1316194 RepID=UPI0025455D33|nr:uncharacterized protein N7473_011853 [Penicillium subrubescens]KAJ5880800.1 hypothetical protein N7473_011853 [Penicillium subrubescens]
MDSLSSASSCEDLIQQLQRLMTSDAYSELLLIVKENAILRQHERDLNITNEQNLKTLGHLQQNLETATEQIAEYSTQVDGLTQEIQRLQIALNNAQGNMKIKDEELRENKKSTTKLAANLKQRETELANFKQCLNKERENSKTEKDARIATEHDLTLLKREISTLSERLQCLNQFTVDLRKPDRDIIRDQLQDMFKLVHSLIVEFFGHDLENPAFQDQTTWENLRNHDLLKRIVPLPLSNTTSAKDMRVAALIGICAEAMSRHIFQSTYLLDGSQLHELIDALQSYDWNQGSYLRSVLLRSLITEQKENSLKRTKRLVAEVLKLTKPLLSAKRQVLFEDALLVVCKKITEQWMQFQELEAAVEPDFELNDDAGDWKLFLFPKRAMNNNVEFPQDPDPKKAEAKLSMMQTNFVVWPAFFISEAGELELLRPGFALSEEQMQPAKSEENAISSRRARQEARRTNRRKAKISAT